MRSPCMHTSRTWPLIKGSALALISNKVQKSLWVWWGEASWDGWSPLVHPLSDWFRSARSSRQGSSWGDHRQHCPALLDSWKGQRQPHHRLHHPGADALYCGLAGCWHRYRATLLLSPCSIYSGLYVGFYLLIIQFESIWKAAWFHKELISALQCRRWSTVTCWQPQWWVWTPGWSTSSGWWPAIP